ncbi:dual specificity protein phosphatase family protein [Thermodesulfovibrio yellowstonii]|uniref:Tyrosine specific protein phosphatases domain-containing protein n=1 Tax=Thermodesulfovibrio yellowstonii TaxID=28262 RepID=A0A9W6GH34_9BACT|nr:dual specificity protein phosphatase family protein [Thermodesulfovibrio islandicus]GLI53857.1 hypothetical protein TISLANDTSLP1_15500 [Thermodesulfovibrio islandicus]
MAFRLKKTAIFFASLVIISLVSLYIYMEEQGNFHEITPGEAYRSAQLDRDELEYYIKKYNIKSILNLRGENPDAPWYIEELQVSSELNVKHYDIALSATRKLTDREIHKLIEIFKSAPRPILIHCKSGADRSGLIAAIWKVVVDGVSESEAKKQLTPLYGHLSVNETKAMDESFDEFFEKWTKGIYSETKFQRLLE